jgi:hypothetical protein
MRVRSRKAANKMTTNACFNVGEATASTEVNSPYSTGIIIAGLLVLGSPVTTKPYRMMLLFSWMKRYTSTLIFTKTFPICSVEMTTFALSQICITSSLSMPQHHGFREAPTLHNVNIEQGYLTQYVSLSLEELLYHLAASHVSVNKNL